MSKLKELFKTLLLRDEDVNYDNPFWIAQWINAKVNLLSCPDVVDDIKSILKEEDN